MDKELLEILVCPETKSALEFADEALLVRLNKQVTEKTLRNRAGALVEQPIEVGLVRADRKVCYVVRQGIPVMLVEEGILLEV